MNNSLQTIIGLEIHVQLKTKTKMFCRCSNSSEEVGPNENVCPICMGMPGVLPAANKKAIRWTALTGLALDCQVNQESKFDRKHYFYPDLPKGFQISQYDQPIAQNGFLMTGQRGDQKVGIERVHLEEDAGKLLHPKDSQESLVDLNRAGTPLMEVVSRPDIRSPRQAKEFLKLLKLTVIYLGVSDADMEKGQLRCDANISVQKGKESTMIVEIKNMNSFRAVYDALTYEEKRLKENFEEYKKEKRKETRGWLADKKKTIEQRYKEEAADYRYFPEPDIPPLKFSMEEVKEIASQLPRLPFERREEYQELGLSDDQFWGIIGNRDRVRYFEKVVRAKADIKEAANWLINEEVSLEIKPEHLAEFTHLRKEGRLPGPLAKQVLSLMTEQQRSPKEIIKEQGLEAEKGESLEKIIRRVIKEHQGAVREYQKGKENAIQFLIGQVMRESQGRADPTEVQKILKEELK